MSEDAAQLLSPFIQFIYLRVPSRTSDNHVLPLGSDFPVESPNPLLGFYAAVSRLSVNGDSPLGEGIAWWVVVVIRYIIEDRMA